MVIVFSPAFLFACHTGGHLLNSIPLFSEIYFFLNQISDPQPYGQTGASCGLRQLIHFLPILRISRRISSSVTPIRPSRFPAAYRGSLFWFSMTIQHSSVFPENSSRNFCSTSLKASFVQIFFVLLDNSIPAYTAAIASSVHPIITRPKWSPNTPNSFITNSIGLSPIISHY